jgi:predicted transcriptional regulator
MNTVVFEVRSLKETIRDATRAIKTGRADREARIGFTSPELLWEVLSAKRWELLHIRPAATAASSSMLVTLLTWAPNSESRDHGSGRSII